MKEQRGARLGSKRSFFKWPSPPRGKTTNDFGKLRALEVRLVREVKVLNQFLTLLYATIEVPKHERRGSAQVHEVKVLNPFFAANVNAFERYMKA